MLCSVGVEFELLAPSGSSRLDLAEKTASQLSGTISNFWHPQVEPSLVPGMKIFHNLTPGFRIHDASGHLLASYVGDLTITNDLNRSLPSKPGWFRLLSDDLRLLELLARQAGVELSSAADILRPIAGLFGTELRVEDDVVRVEGKYGSPIALGTGLPGERERVTEVVTGILNDEFEQRLEELLAPARELGFTVPMESATHIHFDAHPFRSPHILANLVELFNRYQLVLRYLFQTNPHAVRLGPWPPELLQLTRSDDFRTLTWDEAIICLKEVSLTKYCDINIRNMVYELPDKNTIEVRILPGLIHAKPVVVARRLIEAIFLRAIAPERVASGLSLSGNEKGLQLMLDELGWEGAMPTKYFTIEGRAALG